MLKRFLSKRLVFQKEYVFGAIVLLLIEVSIALWVNDNFVRPYVGDFLVQIFVYFCLHSFLAAPVMILAAISLGICYGVELLQAFHFVDRMGLAENRIASTLIGTHFSWFDILAYTLGFATVLYAEQWRKKRQQ